MKLFYYLILFSIPFGAGGQELFTYSEPASNMAAKSIGFRLNNYIMREKVTNRTNYHFLPELMWGISKKLMLHGEGFFSNRNKGFVAEGGLLYLKYRFYSTDEVHSHFRMAAYGRAAINNSDVHQPAIDLNGHNSGYEWGLVATKLINKTAISATAGILHATDNSRGNKFNPGEARDAVGYTLSVGKLFLPKEYVRYEQTNVNGMLEFPGQTNLKSGKTFVDAAPSVQFILLSKMRVDIGYRFPLINDLERTAGKGFLLRFEYTFFNAVK